MKIYTKKGDNGETFLANGEKVYKFDSRVELYGMCDELNSYIGVCCSIIKEKYMVIEELQKINERLIEIQNLLFEIGAELAGYYKEKTILQTEDIINLEQQIDFMSEKLPELRTFILPGGSLLASFLHLCRTQTRKLERNLVYIIFEKNVIINHQMIVFFNRLSDYFFVLARYVNYILKINDQNWYSKRKKNI